MLKKLNFFFALLLFYHLSFAFAFHFPFAACFCIFPTALLFEHFYKHLHDLRIELCSGTTLQLKYCIVMTDRLLVRTFACHYIISVSYGQHPGKNWNRLPG